MPYSIARDKGCSPGKPWAVVKDSDGSVVACHETKDGALSQIRALYAAEPALAKARQRVLKHLSGKHDQSTHGSGGGGISSPPSDTPKRNKKDIAGDDQRAYEMYQSGKTWDQVAQEMGYANGGVARRAGKRHEERQKEKPEDGTSKPGDKKPDDTATTGDKKPDETPIRKPDDTPVIPPTPTPEIVDIVTPPRPMTDSDPSQQLKPTDSLAEAHATGRPLRALTDEANSPLIAEAEQMIVDHRKRVDTVMAKHKDAIDELRARDQQRVDAYKAAFDAKAATMPQQPGEKDWDYRDRVDKAVRADGNNDKYFSVKTDGDYLNMVKNSGNISDADKREIAVLEDNASNLWNTHRRLVEQDTAEAMLGVKMENRPVLDYKGEQKTYQHYDPVSESYVEKPLTTRGYSLPDPSPTDPTRTRWVPHDDIFRDDTEFPEIEQTTRWRNNRLAQKRTRQEFIDADGDGKYREAEKEQLRRQQAIVDSPHTRIVVHAPLTAVGGITQSGFKSQLETGRGKGFKGRETREGFEAATLGVVHGEDKSNGVIYAALHLGGVRPPEAIDAEQYGEVGFVLKREVHQRSTFTEGDSLSMCYEMSPLTGKQTQVNGHAGTGGVDQLRRPDGTRSGLENDEFDASLMPTPRKMRVYHEAQVLGGVSMDDIDYVTIPKGTKLPATARRRLEARGIPIVEYDMDVIAPPVVGVNEYYPDKGKPYTTPKYEAGGLWSVIPEPTSKRAFVANIWKHLAGKHDQSSHAGARHGGYRLKDPDNPKPDASVSAESRNAAKAMRDHIVSIEPAMTRDMIDLAGVHGGEMVGLDFRIKSEKSLARKVEAEKGDFGGDATKTAESMSDVVRYTMAFDEGQYVGGTQAVIADLEAKGYKTRVKNYWTGNDPYQGVNVAVTHPDGTVFELQFHTPKSVSVKEDVHLIYERYRTSTSARDRYTLYDSMVRISNKIPVPSGDILGFGDLKVQPFTLKMAQLIKHMTSFLEMTSHSSGVK